MLKPGDVVDVNEILAYYGEYLPEYEYGFGVVEHDLEVDVYGQVP